MKRYIRTTEYIYSDEVVEEQSNSHDMYILYSSDGSYDSCTKDVYETLEEARNAYTSCRASYKFLYQPDKTYFLGTISATSSETGWDHRNRKVTKKGYGLFIANTRNQISKFLKEVAWSISSYYEGTNVRLMGNGPYSSLYMVNKNSSNSDWDDFEYNVYRYYLIPSNISYMYQLAPGFGAVDVINGKPTSNPYRLT